MALFQRFSRVALTIICNECNRRSALLSPFLSPITLFLPRYEDLFPLGPLSTLASTPRGSPLISSGLGPGRERPLGGHPFILASCGRLNPRGVFLGDKLRWHLEDCLIVSRRL